MNSNIIIDNGGSGIQINTGCTNNIVVGNIVNGNTTAEIADGGTGTVSANNITS